MPVLALEVSVQAWRTRLAVHRRGGEVHFAVGRGSFGELARLRCELDVPHPRMAETVAAVGGLVAEAAATAGLTVGCVGAVPGEEPVLVALAPQRDLVAGRVRWALGAGEAHRYPHLWLALKPGCYLAQAVDPFAPLEPEEGTILGILRGGRVSHALLTEVVPGPVSTRIVLAAYAPRALLRTFLRISRSELAGLDG